MQTYGNPDVSYGWWAGNSRLASSSGLFISAHVGHAGLISVWAGGFTLFELGRYTPNFPMWEQGFVLLPHLAAEGIGMGAGGVIVDPQTIFAVGMVHIIAGAVLGAGALFHLLKAPHDLSQASGVARTYHFEWDDTDKLSRILGHHLLILGIYTLLFVGRAMFWGGLYDPDIQDVRLVSDPTLSPATIFGYQTHFDSVDNLEDIVGGHIFIALLDIAGGIFHLLIPMLPWAKKRIVVNGEAILSYSLGAVAFFGFLSAYWCSVNTYVWPEEFYGPALQIKFGIAPYFADTVELPYGVHSARCWLSNATYILAFYFLQGHLWHALRGLGFDFQKVENFLNSMTGETQPTTAKPKSSTNAMAPIPSAAPPAEAQAASAESA